MYGRDGIGTEDPDYCGESNGDNPHRRCGCRFVLCGPLMLAASHSVRCCRAMLMAGAEGWVFTDGF